MSHMLACQRVKVAHCPARIPTHYLEQLEQNQKLASCCRHPENHDIEAWFSCEDDAHKGVPDIYIFICGCGRKHRRFCVGGGDRRPFWEIR